MKKWNYKETYTNKGNRPNGCELEHRVIASQILGRNLYSSEVVHHVDEDKSNNVPENLIVFKTTNDHSRFHENGLLELLNDGTYISPPTYPNAIRLGDGSCKISCIDCGKDVYRNSTRCEECNSIYQRKVGRPSKDILLEDIKLLGYCGTGRKYGVSDNAIRKWLK